MASNDGSWTLVTWLVDRTGAHSPEGVLREVSTGLWPPQVEGFGEAVRQLSFQLEQLRGTSELQTEAVFQNTEAVIQNTVAQASGGKSSTASSVGQAVGRVLRSGLGLAPLLTGLLGLFRREPSGGSAPALVSYERPPAIHFEGLINRSGESGRTLSLPGSTGASQSSPEWSWARKLVVRDGAMPERGPVMADGSGPWTPRWGWDKEARRVEAPVNVTVEVRALDSRSFLEHSEDIARAVREAMLHSHALNDVVSEL